MRRFAIGFLTGLIALSAQADTLNFSFDVEVTLRYTMDENGFFVLDPDYAGDSFLMTGSLESEPFDIYDSGIQDDGGGGHYRYIMTTHYATWDWSPLSVELDALNPLGSNAWSGMGASATNLFSDSLGGNSYQFPYRSTGRDECEQTDSGIHCDSFFHGQTLALFSDPGYQSFADVTVPGIADWYRWLGSTVSFSQEAETYSFDCNADYSDCQYVYHDGIMYEGTARPHRDEVPVPGTLGLLGVGLAGLVLTRRKTA